MTRLKAEIDPKSTAVDLVTFDLTWLDLTVACDLSRLQTTSKVQKLWWTCVNNAMTGLSVLVLFMSHWKVLVLQLLSVVICFCAEAVRWNARTSKSVYSKASKGGKSPEDKNECRSPITIDIQSLQCESKKNPTPAAACGFRTFFWQTVQNFKSIFTHLLHVPIYARLHIFCLLYTSPSPRD